MGRALRGMCEGKISHEDFMSVAPAYAESSDTFAMDQEFLDAENEEEADRLFANLQQKEDDNLRECLFRLKNMADNAGIPDEPYQIDFSDELRKVVDRALEGKG
jgi:hypothetical protein